MKTTEKKAIGINSIRIKRFMIFKIIFNIVSNSLSFQFQ